MLGYRAGLSTVVRKTGDHRLRLLGSVAPVTAASDVRRVTPRALQKLRSQNSSALVLGDLPSASDRVVRRSRPSVQPALALDVAAMRLLLADVLLGCALICARGARRWCGELL